MPSKDEKIYLALAGATLILVGSFIGLTPTHYFLNFNPDVAPTISYLSELRGTGGTLLMFGLLACIAIRDSRFAETAVNATTLVFASFAAFRMLSIARDGSPEAAVQAAMLIELALASAGLMIIRQRSRRSSLHCSTQPQSVSWSKRQ